MEKQQKLHKTVQADIRFYEGSIIIEGTILIMSWLGPIALAAGKKAFEAEFSRVVEVATQRVLQTAFRIAELNIAPVRKLEVTPQNVPEPQNVAPVRPQDSQSTSPGPASTLPPTTLSQYLPLLTVANTVVLFFLLILQVMALLPK
jgi:hypothetical protein